MKNYYDTLGVSILATEEEIKRAYRKLAFKFHPDYNQGDKFFEDRFKDIQEAYDTLNDRAKKIQYDRKLHSILNPPNVSQQTTSSNSYSTKNETKSNTDNQSYESARSNKEFTREPKASKTNKSIVNILSSIIIGIFVFILDIVSTLLPRLLFIGIIVGIIFGISETCDSKHESKTENTVANGNLDDSFKNSPNQAETTPNLTPEQQYQSQKRDLLAQGWNEKNIRNGVMSSCYNFKPRYGKLKNRLAISVGNNTDVAIKLMDQSTNRCIRYVYVNSNSHYEISNIPEGIYYLKIAYGTDWISRIENGKCIGKFLRGSLYKRGDDILDFHRKSTYEGYSIPSFSLQLDVIASDYSNQFDSQSITESDFNN